MTQPIDQVSQGAVNFAELLMHVDNDRELLDELIGIFKEDFPSLLLSLQQSVARDDMKNVQAASHALKGMLSGLAATRAAAIASRLEQLGRDGEALELTAVMTLLESEVTDVLLELDRFKPETKL